MMECKFGIGQKVVCVKEFSNKQEDERVPSLNKIYTIISMRYGVEPHNKNHIFLVFNEVGTYVGGVKTGYNHTYFKPLDETRRDMFKKMITNIPESIGA